MKKFWETEEGKILMHGIHDHSHGLQFINSALSVIGRTLESEGELDVEELKKDLELIEKGRDRCKDSVDYIYKELKELKEKKQ